VKRANHILADSESTKRDLLDLLSVDPEDVSVLYPGVEPRFAPVECPDELRRVRARYRLPDRFVLGLGTLQPRKNFDGLIAAFGQLVVGQDRHPEIAGLHLVIAGDEGWLYDDVYSLVDRLRLDDRVLFSGFVDDADLPALYTLAAAFAFPSWYEGFGLPVLEAMACGTPVVAAQNSSLPEVIGQAGILVDAADQDALARSLFRLLTEPDLVRNLRDLGLRQSRQFTWEGAAAKLLKTYEALYSAAEIQHRS
jgi:glycosyltransferase involved in cell wall biosynthesis